MRTIFLAIFLFLDYGIFAQGYNYVAPAIPSGGLVQTLDSTISPNNVFVGTAGASVNLGSNSYSIQFQGTPAAGTSFICRADLSKLTAVASNVSIFGLTPLKDYPNQGIYYILYQVSGTRSNNKQVFVSYTGSMIAQGGNINSPTIFNAKDTHYGGIEFQTAGAITPGAVVRSTDDSGTLGYGCVPWCTSGNRGLSSATAELGTLDTAILQFVQDGQACGFIDYVNQLVAFGSSALSGTSKGQHNVAIGGSAMGSGATGQHNCAFGENAMTTLSSGSNNTAVGYQSMQNNTSGFSNVGVGYASLNNITTGSDNTAIGVAAGAAITTGTNNVCIGWVSNTLASAINAVSINGTASSNQFTVGGVENAYFPGMNSGVGYVLTDTSGTGNFVPTAPYLSSQTTYTSVTGDSITPVTGSNLINPAGTLANLTIRVPGTPTGAQIMEFSFTQAITSIHWSIALNQAHSVFASVPTSAAQGGTIKIQYNSATNTWYSW